MEKEIEMKKVSKRFGKKNVLSQIDLTVYKGDVYGLLGLNGSGKSTLMKIFLGLISKDSGQIKVNGQIIEDLQTPKKVGALIEFPSFYEYLNAEKNLSIFTELYGLPKKRIAEVLELVGLDMNNKDKIKHYSMGMKQRLSIARAFLNNPDIIILDEPTNGLDSAGVIEIENLALNLAKHENKTFIITSHILNQVEKVCNRVGILSKGIILSEGDVKTLLAAPTEQYVLELEQSINVDEISNLLHNLAKVISIQDNKITVEIDNTNIGEISALLSNNHLNIRDIQKKTKDLEAYFMERLKIQ